MASQGSQLAADDHVRHTLHFAQHGLYRLLEALASRNERLERYLLEAALGQNQWPSLGHRISLTALQTILEAGVSPLLGNDRAAGITYWGTFLLDVNRMDLSESSDRYVVHDALIWKVARVLLQHGAPLRTCVHPISFSADRLTPFTAVEALRAVIPVGERAELERLWAQTSLNCREHEEHSAARHLVSKGFCTRRLWSELTLSPAL